ncbi:MAG: winged helix-turn-helix transcriptional regulator, partial [Candidatus Bathyarchaeia archaeon]
MSQMKIIDTCPVQGVIDVISKKWSLLTIAVLGNSKKLRFHEIMLALKGITPKTITETLRQLE